MQKKLEATISGRVQMVMYRDFAQRHARKLRLVGWVRNNPDGTVTVVAVGDEEVLKKYEFQLQKGSIVAKVEDVVAVYTDPGPSDRYYGFEIRYE